MSIHILEAAKKVLGHSQFSIKYNEDGSWVILDTETGLPTFEESYEEIKLLSEELSLLGLVPLSVSRRQLLSALVLSEFISPEEALNANNTVPSGIELIISNLPEEEQVFAKIKWLNFTEAYRNDSLVTSLGEANSLTEREVDDFFRLAGTL